MTPGMYPRYWPYIKFFTMWGNGGGGKKLVKK
jgi:hypothetical protein